MFNSRVGDLFVLELLEAHGGFVLPGPLSSEVQLRQLLIMRVQEAGVDQLVRKRLDALVGGMPPRIRPSTGGRHSAELAAAGGLEAGCGYEQQHHHHHRCRRRRLFPTTVSRKSVANAG